MIRQTGHAYQERDKILIEIMSPQDEGPLINLCFPQHNLEDEDLDMTWKWQGSM